MRYNLHAIKVTHFKCMIQQFLVSLHSWVNTTTTLFWKLSVPPERSLITFLTQSASSFPHQRQPPICFVSLWICLFWTFHITETIQCVDFCVWLFSPSMFSRFIRVAHMWVFLLLFSVEYYSIAYMNGILFTQSLFDGHLVCFHF